MVLFLDSFDHYTIPFFAAKWNQLYVGGGYLPTIGVTGRRGTSAIRYSSPNIPVAQQSQVGAIVLPNTQDTTVMGSAFRVVGGFGSIHSAASLGSAAALTPSGSTASGTSTPITTIFHFRNASRTQVGIHLNRDGTLYATRGTGVITALSDDKVDATLGTTALALQANAYYYIEAKVRIHDTLGTVEIRVNGDVWLALTGLDTHPPDTALYTTEFCTGMIRWAVGNAVSFDYDDLYILNTDASVPTNTPVDFLGDIQVNYQPPIVDVVRDWTPLSGIDHWAMVDEIPPDDDVTYNSTETLNAIDTFQVASAPVVGANVLAMQVIFDVRRTESGNTSTAPVFRVGGVNYVGAAQGNTSTYTMQRGVWTQNPATLAAITDTVFNASSVGYKKTA